MTITYLTLEGYKKLEDELEYLRTTRRKKLQTVCAKRWKAMIWA